jgi:hypothetical protein
MEFIFLGVEDFRVTVGHGPSGSRLNKQHCFEMFLNFCQGFLGSQVEPLCCLRLLRRDPKPYVRLLVEQSKPGRNDGRHGY